MSKSLNELVADIKSMKIRGANKIAIQSLKFLKTFSKKKGFGKDFQKAVKKLEKTRPTAVVLHNCLEIVKKEKDVESIDKLLRRLREASRRIAERGRNLIKNGDSIMVHCHSTEALGIIERAWRDKKKFKVYVTETEPRLQGIITAKELARRKIPVILIVDSAIEYFIKDVSMILVGTDAMRKEGVVNKIGTYTMAIVAKEHKIPFYVAGNTLKLDKRKKFVIEERDPDEVYVEHMKTLEVRNPAFDITPWKYVKRVVTEKGIMTSGNVKKMIK